MKRTVLDDDAGIYQKRKRETEKEKWERMDKTQRKQYFLDYYLFKVTVGAILAAIVLFLLWHFLSPKDENILYVAVLDESLNEKETAALTEELKKLFSAGEHQKVMIDDSFYMKDGALDKLEIYLHSGQIDVVIAEKDTYEELAGFGFFQNLEEFPDEKAARYQAHYQYAAGYQENELVSFEDNETGKGEELPYGIEISESRQFAAIKTYIETPVLAIAANAPHPENAAKFLDVMMK